jgi:glutamate-1-semialdehyde 2,1-aminomutase
LSAEPKKLSTERSAAAMRRAEALMPGGVSSPVRAFRAVGGHPIFIASGRGATITDIDGNSYVDYVCSWGPLIAGHAHPRVIEAVKRAAEGGTSFGAPTEREIALAERITAAMPSVEQVRFVNSGTEAVMSALRLARAATGRPGIVKFQGCYHGHADSMLVEAGSGAMTLGVPSSPGVPAEVARLTHTVAFNDLDAVRALCARESGQIAAIIVEPVVGNMGVVPPVPGFLQGLRQVADEHGILLILDEVMTGFRVALGGAAARYGVRPDLVTLGKVIGGGLPVGAYGGRKDLMQQVSPAGPVYQAGTLSGNPLAMAAGIATLDILAESGTATAKPGDGRAKPGAYEALEEKSARLEAGLAQAVAETGTAARVQRVGSMLTLFFSANPVTDYPSAARCDTAAYGRFFRNMLARGTYLPASQFEAWFVSLAHGDEEIARTVAAARAALYK